MYILNLMFLKNIKKILKLKFPIITNKLITFRDNNKLLRFFFSLKSFDVNKSIHGKKIVNINRLSKNNDIFLSYTVRPKFANDTFNNISFENNSKW